MTTRNPFLREHAYVDGSWAVADSAETIDVTNPATGEILGTVPDMGKVEAARAIAAAQKALPDWAAHSAQERADILMKLYNLFLVHQDDLALLMTQEQCRCSLINQILQIGGFIGRFCTLNYNISTG